MSDFDKEEERRKLREKYEKEAHDREATQRMSDLLLKGATMTSNHCGVCGDPIFRYDGEAFCPSCQGTGEVPDDPAEAAREQAQSSGSAAGGADTGASAAESNSAEASADAAAGAESATQGAPAGRAATDGSTAIDVQTPAGSAQSAGGSGGDEAAWWDGVPVEPAGDDSIAIGGSASSLATALEYCAQNAAAADDPRTAREWLEAAHEAADALAALRR